MIGKSRNIKILINALWKRFQFNKYGKIDIEDAVELMKMVGPNIDKDYRTDDRILTAFKEIDENGDGLLSKREIYLFIMKEIGR